MRRGLIGLLAVVIGLAGMAIARPDAANAAVVVTPSTGLGLVSTASVTGLPTGILSQLVQCAGNPEGFGTCNDADAQLVSPFGAVPAMTIRARFEASGAVVDCRIAPGCTLATRQPFGVFAVASLGFLPRRSFPLGGTVTTSGGAPIGGASVRLDDRLGPNADIVLTTNGAGEWSTSVPDSPVDITIGGPSGSDFAWETRSVDVTANTTLDVALLHSVTLRGRVTDPNGDPVADANVQFGDGSGNFGGDCFGVYCQTTTDANGDYALVGIHPTDALIAVVQPAGPSLLLPFPPPPDYATDETFAAPEGATVVDDVQLEYGGSVRFEFHRADGPLLAVEGEICNAAIESCYAVEALPDGSYGTIETLLPGEYAGFIRVEGFREERAIGAFDVAAGEITLVEELTELVALNLTVTTHDAVETTGDVAFDCAVQYWCTEVTPIDIGVTTSILVPVGSLHLVAEADAPSPYLPAERIVAIVAGPNALAIELQPGALIEVTLDNAEFEGAWACPVGRGRCLEGARDAEVITFGGAAPGKYDVYANAFQAFVPKRFSAIAPGVEVVGIDTAEVVLHAVQDEDQDRVPTASEPGGVNGGVDDALPRVAGSSAPRVVVNGRLEYVLARDPADVASPPSSVSFAGSMTAVRAETRGSTLVKLRYPTPVESVYVLRGDRWRRVDGAGTEGATIDGRRVTLRVIDGGRNDGDGVVNGSVLVHVARGSNGVGAAHITSGPVGFTTSNDADFVVDAPIGATLECSLDLGAFGPCDATPSFDNLADGGHVLVVQPVVAGRAGTADFRYWYAGAPEGRRASGGPTGVTTSRSASFTMTGPQPHDTICMVDFGPIFECGAAVNLSGLAAGHHVLLVFDGAGPHGLSDVRYWVVHRPEG